MKGLNLSATLNIAKVIAKPSYLCPQLIVDNVSNIEFAKLRDQGFRGVVFDKDNCLTLPYHDQLQPELISAWESCKNIFGQENVIIVSNSAGTIDDKKWAQAIRIEKALGVAVLRHSVKKPGCLQEVKEYFQNKGIDTRMLHLPLLIVGDRLLTDVVMANMMGAAAIWTTRLFKPDQLMWRSMENVWLNTALRAGVKAPRHPLLYA